MALDPYLQDPLPYAPFFLAVIATALLCGSGPAVLSTGLGLLGARWSFTSSRPPFVDFNTADFLPALVYIIECLSIIVFAHLLKCARDRAVSRKKELEGEITARNKAEEEIMRFAEELGFISAKPPQKSFESSRSELVDLATERIYSMAGGAIVLFHEFDPQNQKITVTKFRCAPEEREKTIAILGRYPEGMTFQAPLEFGAKIFPGGLELLEGGIEELALGKLPPRLCRLLEDKLTIGKIYFMARSFEDDILLTVAVLTHGRGKPRNKVLVETLVQQLALALGRLRMDERLYNRSLEIHRLGRDLDIRIQERTAKLIEANKILVDSEKRLRLLSGRIIAAQENEKKEVAQKVHDGIRANLAEVKRSLERKLHQLKKGGDPKEIALEEVLSCLQNTIEESRKIQLGLRPSILDDVGIIPAITWYSRETEKAYPGVQIEDAVNVVDAEIPENLELALFRIVEEAVNNAVRHGESSRIRIGLERAGAWLRLTIEDNGRGFEAHADDTGREGGGKGLGIMQQRANSSGGMFSVISILGERTIVRAEWKIAPCIGAVP